MENHWKSTDEWAALEGVPAKDEESLNAVGMRMVGDLLDWFPRRYEDRRHFDAFPAAAGGGAVCLRGMVIDSIKKRLGGKRSFYEIVVEEQGGNILSTNTIVCRWFNMPFLHRMVAAGHEVILYGKPKEAGGRLIIDHPEFVVVKEGERNLLHLERIVPVYRNVSGIPQRRLRELVYRCLEDLDGASVAPVVVARSFVGDLLSDLLAVPVGWVGAVASASRGPSLAVFEPVHGSAPTRATESPLQVNPLGAVRALGLLLEHVGETDAAAWVQVACDTLALHTPDRGGDATTIQNGQALAQKFAQKVPSPS